MAGPLTSDTSSTHSVPVPIAGAEMELEKSTSRASQRTQRTGRSDQVPVTAQDWDGEDDPDNPYNWSILKKIYHTLTPALQSFTMFVNF